MMIATFRSVLTQTELSGPHDFVIIQPHGGLLEVLALERCVESVYISRNSRSPSRARFDRWPARIALGRSSLEDLVKEGSESR